MQNNTPGPGRGERAVDFVLPLQAATPTRFYAVAGGQPTVLLFCRPDDEKLAQRLFDALNKNGLDAIAFIVIKPQASEEQSKNLLETSPPFPVFLDRQGTVRNAYRLHADSQAVAILLDPNLRVLDALCLEDPEVTVTALQSLLQESMSPGDTLDSTSHAPVLRIPNVLDIAMCQQLIDVWQTQGSVDTGVERTTDGRRQESISYAHKRRRDHVVMDQTLLRRLTSTIGCRVMPELQKAFYFKATRFEGFKIACYDAVTGGFFRPHRDNLSPATAHRRFALTVNLNDDYEDGFLRFPEYGSHRYRPEAGGALVFSCAHLHEVTDVTKGRRFALLSFLFREEDIKATLMS